MSDGQITFDFEETDNAVKCMPQKSIVNRFPEGWNMNSINDIASVTKLAGFEFTNDIEYVHDGKVIALRALNIKNGRLVLDDIKRIHENVASRLTRSQLKKGDLVFTYVGTIGDVALIEENNKYHLAPNVAKLYDFKSATPEYIAFYLISEYGKLEINRLTTTTSQPALSMENIRKIRLLLPPLSEQKKIAEILSSVDRSIETTEKLIAKLADLKKALMQQLLTKGIGHTRFKDSPLGKIPESWEIVKIGKVLELCRGRSIKMDDNKEYSLVTVKRRFGGVVLREKLEGKRILVKNQSVLKEGDFLVSKRQIVHGACEIVPVELNGAIVSNEYNIFNSSADLDLNYFRWLSQTHFMSELFFRNSVGVHIEKMLFKTNDWLKDKIALPSLPEQKKIASIISANHARLVKARQRLNKLKDMKKGLMQDLLTGRVRV